MTVAVHGQDHRYIRNQIAQGMLVCKKSSATKQEVSSRYKQFRQANKTGGLGKAGRPTRQAGQQGRRANKAGGPTRQVCLQGRWANKAGRHTSQASHQGRQAGRIDVTALAADIFATATYRTNIHHKIGSWGL